MIRSRWSYQTLLAGLSLAVLAGCGQLEGPTAPEPPAEEPLPGGVLNGLGANLLLCTPLDNESVTQTVGPSGGVINVGPHRLEIPAGALTEPVEITAQIPGGRVNSIRLAPHGLEFAQPALLTMSYANCTLAVLLPKRIVYTTETLSLLEILQSLDDALDETVSAPLDHFSRYAVAW